MKSVLSPEIVARTRHLSDEAFTLALEAYRQGRHQGAAFACTELDSFARAQIADIELDGALAEHERVAIIEALERMRAEVTRISRRAVQEKR